MPMTTRTATPTYAARHLPQGTPVTFTYRAGVGGRRVVMDEARGTVLPNLHPDVLRFLDGALARGVNVSRIVGGVTYEAHGRELRTDADTMHLLADDGDAR